MEGGRQVSPELYPWNCSSHLDVTTQPANGLFRGGFAFGFFAPRSGPIMFPQRDICSIMVQVSTDVTSLTRVSLQGVSLTSAEGSVVPSAFVWEKVSEQEEAGENSSCFVT